MPADPRYRGLLIGNAAFPRDPHALLALRGPLVDIEKLGQVLTDDKVGLFPSGNVVPLPDRGVQDLREHLDKFFTTAERDDVLLLYYSGHGRLDEYGKLYLCAGDTMLDRLRATALSAAEINNMIDGSPAATVIIVLDCCHSGAFKTGVDLAAPVAGKGRYVLASNRSTQLARDAEVEGQPSPFTGMLVRGLRHAQAAGHLTVSELYRQVHHWMTEDTPRPPQLSFAGEGDVAIARREGNRPWTHVQPRKPRQGKKKKGKPTVEPTPETVLQTAKSFEESWTGNEDPRAFSEHVADPEGYFFCAFGLFMLGSPLSMFGDWKGGTIGAVICYIMGGLALLKFWRDVDPYWLPRGLRRSMRERTLSIGPAGITATDDAGRQHIPWSAIGKVAVRHADTTVRDYRPLALHLQMHGPNPEAPTVLFRPAGWPEGARLPAVCRGPQVPSSSDWVPVCVLGPLSGPRRVELKNAVAAHTKHPLETEDNW
ncbi:caspase family protein [Streptomyces sp. NPDC006539]|uniref:caspase family protein n=1 Tax=Streptomyces sp. NPDC006539 TaxID=3155352 RepID=UPI0033B4F5A6